MMRRCAVTIASLMMTILVHATVQAQDPSDSAEAYRIDEAMLQELAELEATAEAEAEATELEAAAAAEAELGALVDVYPEEGQEDCPRVPYSPSGSPVDEFDACLWNVDETYQQRLCMGERVLTEGQDFCDGLVWIATTPPADVLARLCETVLRLWNNGEYKGVQEAYEDYRKEAEELKDGGRSACNERYEAAMAARSNDEGEGIDPGLIPDTGPDPADLEPPAITLMPADQPAGGIGVIECASGDPGCDGHCFSTEDGRICCYQETVDCLIREDGSNSGS